jgi:hypothetical protein
MVYKDPLQVLAYTRFFILCGYLLEEQLLSTVVLPKEADCRYREYLLGKLTHQGATLRFFRGAFRTEGSGDLFLSHKIAITTWGLPRLSFITSGQGTFNFSNFVAASKRVYSSIYGD